MRDLRVSINTVLFGFVSISVTTSILVPFPFSEGARKNAFQETNL